MGTWVDHFRIKEIDRWLAAKADKLNRAERELATATGRLAELLTEEIVRREEMAAAQAAIGAHRKDIDRLLEQRAQLMPRQRPPS